MLKVFSLTIILISIAAINVTAQQGNDFMIASELLRQGEYEEAYKILERLLEDNPESYPVYDRAVTTLVNLKRYDEAIRLSEDWLNNDYGDVVAAAKVGELYHIAGDTAKAGEIWNKTLEVNSGSLQAYRHIAHTMNERRAYKSANQVYLKARAELNQPDLFAHEIANNSLVTGNYEQALHEYLKLIASNRDYMFQVQRQLMRFEEQYLLDVAILETEDKISEFRNDSREAATFREFLIWLYMERELYSRALSTARNLESSSSETYYAVYNLGDRLRTHNEFELAESAYSYYTEQQHHEMKARSLEQLARVYMSWAGYLEQNNLNYSGKTDSLYSKAEHTLKYLNANNPRFSRRTEALLLQAELALDHLKDVDEAVRYHEELIAQSSEEIKPQLDYLEGRIHLFNHDFNRARVAFTQSNRAARIGNLADKTRYYLALTDFYSGDYDFSQIQLRALERQNTSFFANNALQLRFWIQEGVNADSTATELDAFSKARFHYHVTGETDQALKALTPLLNDNQNHPLNGEAVLLAASIIRNQNGRAALHLVNSSSTSSLNPASMERIFWVRAQLADHVYFDQTSDEPLADHSGIREMLENLRQNPESVLIGSVNEVIGIYEELLIEYPQGFYAEKARERIRDLMSVTN